MSDSSPADARTLGRPRSPNVEQQALRAAFEIYGERGWSHFSFGEVARRAGVGKAALYLRWPTKAALVLACIEARQESIGEIDTGSLRGDLLELAKKMYEFVGGGSGTVALRLQVESRIYPELYAGLESRAYSQPIKNARRIIRRAIARGELPAGLSPTVITDLIAGAVLNHVLATPPRLREAARARSSSYFAELVDVVLRGVNAAPVRVAVAHPDRRSRHQEAATDGGSDA